MNLTAVDLSHKDEESGKFVRKIERSRKMSVDLHAQTAMTLKTEQTDKLHRIFWEGIEGKIELQNVQVYRSHGKKLHKEKENNEIDVVEITDEEKRGLFLINPVGQKRIWWDVISGMAILYSAIEVPFLIAFLPDGTILSNIDLAVTAIFFVDIIISFSMPYQDRTTNEYVYSRRLIAEKYMQFWVWLDLLATIPFDTIAANTTSGPSKHVQGVRLIRILRLFRLAKLLKFSKNTQEKIKNQMEYYNMDPSILSGFVLIVQIFYVAHLIGCFWYFISTPAAWQSTRMSHNTDDGTGIRTWANVFGTTDSEV